MKKQGYLLLVLLMLSLIHILSTYDYKRIIKANDRATLLNLMVGLNAYTPVSYTHLDVYKRQVLGHMLGLEK